MSRLVALSTLVERCQKRCDLEEEEHVSAAEWKELISEQYGDLYSVVAESGLRHFESTYTITSTGALYYALPADHLATVAIARILASTGGTPSRFGNDLREIMAQEQSRASGQTGEARRYAVIANNVWLYPAPPSGHTYQLRYVAQSPQLGAAVDATEVDLVTPDGEAFLIWGVAVKALAKSESDTRVAALERDQAKARFKEWTILRALHQPRRKVVLDDELDGSLLDDSDWRVNP